MDFGLQGKTAIVGGGNRGLGRAVAVALAREGVNVVLSARDENRLADVVREIEASNGAEAVPVRADHTQATDIKNIVDTTLDRFGKIDILFTNTGGPPSGDFFDFTDAHWDQAYTELLLYVVRIYREVIPHMQRQGSGRIINNASVTVKEPYADLLLSNVFRVGVVSLAKTLSRKLAGDGILINTICPGFTKTDRALELLGDRARVRGVSLEEMERMTASDIPLGYIPEPDGVASLVVFLASDRASSITGATIQVDGGFIKGLY